MVSRAAGEVARQSYLLQFSPLQCGAEELRLSVAVGFELARPRFPSLCAKSAELLWLHRLEVEKVEGLLVEGLSQATFQSYDLTGLLAEETIRLGVEVLVCSSKRVEALGESKHLRTALLELGLQRQESLLRG